MAKCKLCLKKEANQLGSHITSAFLLSSQIGKRGEEKGFTISTDPNQNYGQDVGAEDQVWVSATGSKYHSRNNCGNMNPDAATQMSRSEAEAKGLTPCKKCY